MINLRGIERICIVGGGTAGWFMALHLRKIFSSSVEIRVIATSEIPIVGVGEGGILNLIEALERLDIPLLDFMRQTGAVHKLGFAYEGWRTGKADDVFYHMFPSGDPEIFWEEWGYFPSLSLLLNHNIPISSIVDSIRLHEENVSQNYITDLFVSKKTRNFLSSFHFDAYRVGKYLKKIALQRGVIYMEGEVRDTIQNSETGLVTELNVNGELISSDFIIDASGFSRLLIDKKFKSEWHSFSNFLVMNKAIPFHLKHKKANPDLVTRSTAMNAGWLWQIPLQERIGAGYVFNDNFINETQALDELEKHLKQKIDPITTLSFEAGFYKTVWNKNVLAIGLASGFVEPLEATSIGQMLAQTLFFCNIVQETHGIIHKHVIDFYNQQNAQAWHGIGDFIRLHYDTGRTDTDFWRFANELPVSNKYNELKECWQERTPRKIDFVNYEMDGFPQFGVYSWLTIGQSLGIISPEVSTNELMALTPAQHQKLAYFLNKIKSSLYSKQ